MSLGSNCRILAAFRSSKALRCELSHASSWHGKESSCPQLHTLPNGRTNSKKYNNCISFYKNFGHAASTKFQLQKLSQFQTSVSDSGCTLCNMLPGYGVASGWNVMHQSSCQPNGNLDSNPLQWMLRWCSSTPTSMNSNLDTVHMMNIDEHCLVFLN